MYSACLLKVSNVLRYVYIVFTFPIFMSDETKVATRIVLEKSPFPRAIEDRMHAFSNCANTEPKILTVLSMDGNPLTPTEIRHRVVDMIRGDSWIPGDRSFAEYCELTLIPIGAVARGSVTYGERGGTHPAYALGSEGLSLKPLFQYVLGFGVDVGRSLCEILGSTKSVSSSRSPLRRLRIYEELGVGEGEALRAHELAERVDRSCLKNQLRTLERSGIVGHKTVGRASLFWLTNPRFKELAQTIRQGCSLDADFLFSLEGNIGYNEDPELLSMAAAEGMGNYEPLSSKNRKSRATINREILKFAIAQGRFRPSELADQNLVRCGNMTPYLGDLLKQGGLVREIEGRASWYSPGPKASDFL